MQDQQGDARVQTMTEEPTTEAHSQQAEVENLAVAQGGVPHISIRFQVCAERVFRYLDSGIGYVSETHKDALHLHFNCVGSTESDDFSGFRIETASR